MNALARWCARHRFVVLGGWVAAIVLLVGVAITGGSSFTTPVDLPASDSAHAYALLGSSAQGVSTGRIAWQSTGVDVDSQQVRDEVTGMLTEVGSLPGVVSVASPYDDPSAGGALDAATSTAYADVVVTDDVSVDQVQRSVESADSQDLTVTMGGQAFAPQTKAGGIGEGIGILAALAILLLVFRSPRAAALPILTGVVGVATSLLLVIVGSHVVDLSSDSITMASLIGLGVGIDYALFIVNRHRQGLLAGDDVEDAVAQAVRTSGRAVVFAGLTVIAALLGIVVVGLGVLTGMGQAAALTVACTVLAAITLLPALLAMLGDKVLSKKQRRALADGTAATPAARTGWWSRLVTRAPKSMATLALLVVAAVAVPALSMNIGQADASADPVGSMSRDYYDMTSPAFGKGLDATLLLVAQTPDDSARQAFTTLAENLGDVTDVAAVSPVTILSADVAMVQVTQASNASSDATVTLVHHLRDDVIPSAQEGPGGQGLTVHVGGETATSIDIAHALMSKLPLYLALVAVLGFLLLTLAFRSLLLPLIGAASNIVTVLVGLGVVTAVFQWGWGTDLLGVGEGAPVHYIVPVMIVGVLFGLSMDYQVFLVSRMHEEWVATGHHVRSIRIGLTQTAKVIITAATIMLCVFASFGFSDQRIVSSIGIGMALAVVVDALVVRMVLMPAVMKLVGPRLWSYPRWADRITPHLSVEGEPESTERELVTSRTA